MLDPKLFFQHNKVITFGRFFLLAFLIVVGIGFAPTSNRVSAAANSLDEDPEINCPPGYARPRADFGNDGKSDLLFRDQVTQDLTVWYLDGRTRIGSQPTDPTKPVDGNWSQVGVNDFNRDCEPDLLWQNDDSGHLAIWYMKDVEREKGVRVLGIDPGWAVMGTGFFGPNQPDYYPDILWRNETTGELRLWYMQNTVILSQVDGMVTPSPSAEWVVAAIGYLNDDHWADLLWRNTTTGILRYSFLQGTAETGSGEMNPSSPVDGGWNVVSLFNVDNLNQDDIVWQNQTSSRLVVWYLDGTGTTRLSGEFFDPMGPENLNLKVVGPK